MELKISKIKSFSIVEIVVGLLVVSVALAAFTPIITKRIVKSKNVSANIAGVSMHCTHITPNGECKICKGKKCFSCSKTCGIGEYLDVANCTCVNCTDSNCLECTHNSCKKCTPGYISDDNTCRQCLAGQYQDGAKCKSCPKGTFSASAGQTKCEECPTGKYNNLEEQTSCKSCDEGTYADTTKTINCKSCEEGTYCNAEGCIVCTPCNPGSYCNAEGCKTCTSCAVNTYQENTGQTSCKNCPDNKYTDTTGNSTCYLCSAAITNCVNCTSSTKCTQCDTGYSISSDYSRCCKNITGCAATGYNSSCNCTNCSGVANCSKYDESSCKCNTCNSGYTRNFDKTKCCSTINNCSGNNYNTNCKCTSCNSGSTLNSDGSKCCTNKSNCTAYDADCKCTSCNNGTTANSDGDQCCPTIDNCSGNNYNINCKCTSCNSGFTLNSNGSKCCSTINNCSGNNYNTSCKCTSCNSGTTANSDNSKCCTNKSNCTAYDADCKCTSCNDDYMVENGECVSGQYLTIGNYMITKYNIGTGAKEIYVSGLNYKDSLYSGSMPECYTGVTSGVGHNYSSYGWQERTVCNYNAAVKACNDLVLGGYDNWQLVTAAVMDGLSQANVNALQFCAQYNGNSSYDACYQIMSGHCLKPHEVCRPGYYWANGQIVYGMKDNATFNKYTNSNNADDWFYSVRCYRSK